ncbi:MAG TPA: GntR family transcriptional regulator [bacterium]|nr:GntR family transcriptional regulator [bacterium]
MKVKSPPSKSGMRDRPENLTDRIYAQLKEDIFNFRLLPGDYFSENEVAERVSASRTPVREALTRLLRDGFVEVRSRSGWQVKPFDFNHFEQLYDLRIILEEAAVRKLCEMELAPDFPELRERWLVKPEDRMAAGPAVAKMDERFHEQIVEAVGNQEMARIHHDITERLRIIRRLDFTKPKRVDATYEEHAKILRAILKRRLEEATGLLTEHIKTSKGEVRKITLHMLHEARSHRY